MSIYKFFTTNLLTGQLLADTIPLHVTRFSRNLGGVGQPGQLSGYLDLGVIGGGSQSAYLGALEPRRTVLWVAQDGYPIWAGIVWDWPVTSAKANQLPVVASELGSLFAKRQIRDAQTFTGVDLFTIARALISYATGKTYGAVANLALGSNLSGTTVSIPTIPATNLAKVLDVLNNLAAQYLFEYAFTPGLDGSGNPNITLQLGQPRLGRPIGQTGLRLEYPGPAIDYAFPRVGSASVNSLIATAANSGAAPWTSNPAAHGLNSAELAAGYPLLEESIAYTTSALTTQAQIDAVADGKLPLLTGTTTVPTVTIGGGGMPSAGQIGLGDEAYMVATSWLHPANPNGSPGLQALVRIVGWILTPPSDQDSQAESTQYLLGGIAT
jgi:hypothetical protein